MKLKSFIIFAVFLMLTTSCYADGWITDTVKMVAVRYGNGCILLNSGEMVKLDLSSDAGKAELSIALTALTTGKIIKVYQPDGDLVGGCNTGATIKPHAMLDIVN